MLGSEMVKGYGVLQWVLKLLGLAELHKLSLSSISGAKMEAPSSPLQVLLLERIDDSEEGALWWCLG